MTKIFFFTQDSIPKSRAKLISEMENGGDDEQKICRKKHGKSWNCKNVSGDNILQYCEKHYNQYLDLTNKMEDDDEELPPDEQRCSQTGSGGWRCKSFRMGHADDDGDTVPKTRYCEKHYKYQSTEYKKQLRFNKEKSTGFHGEATAEEIRGSKRRRMKVEDGTGTQNLRATSYNDTFDTIVEEGGTGNFTRKTTEGSREPLVEFESMENYKSKCFELSVELENNKLELEKKKIECTKLQCQLAEFVETRKTTATEETDATQYWRKMFFDLESRVLRTENREESVECPISKLGSLVLRSGEENSTLRFIDLGDSVNIEPEARNLQNDETSCGGGEYSRVYELKTKEELLNMYGNLEEWKAWGCSEDRPSQDHLEMSNTPIANLVSDNTPIAKLVDSETSLGGLLDRLEMKYRNMKENQELGWKLEADMLSSFEKDLELNMKAVCALYRQHIAEAEISTNGFFCNYSDVLRTTTLAKFLMDWPCKGCLKKSVIELEKFDSKGIEDCKRLAKSYSKQLFSIYQTKKDPFFLLATTASHGDQTAK